MILPVFILMVSILSLTRGFVAVKNMNGANTQILRRAVTTNNKLWMSKTQVSPNTPIPTQEVTAAALRSLAVVNVKGDLQTLGPIMGPKKSIVIFMRHLG